MAAPIYLDNSTITRPSERAIYKMLPYLTEHWGSFAAPHQMGQELFPAIEESYRSIYALLGATEKDDFVFTSSGAEAINQVILSGYFDVTMPTGKNQFLTSNIDEAPAILGIGRLEKFGCVGKMISANAQGIVTAEAVAEMITPRTAQLSLSWANGLTGTINQVIPILDLCKERGIRLHLDATHVLGKLFFTWEEIPADLITFDGTHLHAPKGTGGLYCKAGIPVSPLVLGGHEQGGKRAGALDVPALIALGEAAQEALETRTLLCTEGARLRNKLEEGIVEGFPDAQLLFQKQERLPTCTSISFPGIVNEAMLYALNRRGVFASIGGGNFQQLSLLLKASGISDELADCSISFSLSRETTEGEIDRAIQIIVDVAKKLRKVSTHIKKGIV